MIFQKYNLTSGSFIRIRVDSLKKMWIHADSDPQPCLNYSITMVQSKVPRKRNVMLHTYKRRRYREEVPYGEEVRDLYPSTVSYR